MSSRRKKLDKLASSSIDKEQAKNTIKCFEMFSLQGNDDLLIQILSNPCQQSKISQDPVMDYASMATTNINSNINSQKKRPSKRKLSTNNDGQIAAPDDHFKLRRIIHRDIERQRRQEMSVLYSSLRSLLPLQYVKGKRSVSDHMNEAVNYIKELQGNIKELEKQRDLLIKSSPLPNLSIRHGSENDSKNSRFTDCTVTVSPCLQGGIQISISVNCKGKNFPISRILGELLKKGVNVVSCVSAKVDQSSLYTIHTEACDMNNIDHLALQQKVIDMINLEF